MNRFVCVFFFPSTWKRTTWRWARCWSRPSASRPRKTSPRRWWPWCSARATPRNSSPTSSWLTSTKSVRGLPLPCFLFIWLSFSWIAFGVYCSTWIAFTGKNDRRANQTGPYRGRVANRWREFRGDRTVTSSSGSSGQSVARVSGDRPVTSSSGSSGQSVTRVWGGSDCDVIFWVPFPKLKQPREPETVFFWWFACRLMSRSFFNCFCVCVCEMQTTNTWRSAATRWPPRPWRPTWNWWASTTCRTRWPTWWRPSSSRPPSRTARSTRWRWRRRRRWPNSSRTCAPPSKWPGRASSTPRRIFPRNKPSSRFLFHGLYWVSTGLP